MAAVLIGIVLLAAFLAVTGRLGLSVKDLLEPEPDEREWVSDPGNPTIDFHEALHTYGSARRGE